MKPIVFKKDSWHYKLADGMGYPSEDICGYTRQVLEALLLATLGVGICAALLYLVASVPMWIGMMLYLGMFLEPLPGAEGGSIILFFAAVCLICYHASQVDLEAPSFARVAYRSFKEKYCVRVEFK